MRVTYGVSILPFKDFVSVIIRGVRAVLRQHFGGKLSAFGGMGS